MLALFMVSYDEVGPDQKTENIDSAMSLFGLKNMWVSRKKCTSHFLTDNSKVHVRQPQLNAEQIFKKRCFYSLTHGPIQNKQYKHFKKKVMHNHFFHGNILLFRTQIKRNTPEGTPMKPEEDSPSPRSNLSKIFRGKIQRK